MREHVYRILLGALGMAVVEALHWAVAHPATAASTALAGVRLLGQAVGLLGACYVLGYLSTDLAGDVRERLQQARTGGSAGA